MVRYFNPMSAPSTDTGGRGESGLRPALIETARIVNVNINDYTVDAVGEHGNRRFFDVQVMSPYFHFFNGEGWYAMPEVGALCWVAKESPGLFGKHFILGFQAPHDERQLQGSNTEAGNFKANRQTLNPGDQMWRGRDENFVILRRGGVLQIGASPANQRIFVPLGNLIRDFAFGYELETLAGDLKMTNDSLKVQGTEVTQADDAAAVKTRFRIRTKTRANEPGHSVIVTFGSHEDDDDLRLSLQVNESGADGASKVAEFQITKTGAMTATLSDSLSATVANDIAVTSTEGDITVRADGGAMTYQSKGAMALRSTDGTMELQAKGSMELSTESEVAVNATAIGLNAPTAVGGAGGAEPLVKGQQLVNLLTALINGMTNPAAPFGPAYAPGQPILFPGMAALLPTLQTILSTENTTT